jgi:hypothetical protein
MWENCSYKDYNVQHFALDLNIYFKELHADNYLESQ